MMVNNNPDGVGDASNSQHFDNKLKVRRNRRSRRLQKKNSLDVQFRRRFSMLRDVNAASNNIYNASISNGFNGFTDLDATNLAAPSGMMGHDSRSSSLMPGAGLGPRASMGNISGKLLDKKFNKILVTMQQNLPGTSGGGGTGGVSGNESAAEHHAERWSALPGKHRKIRKARKATLDDDIETHNV
jgi:hypothetical protein